MDVLRNSVFTNQQIGRPENGRPYEVSVFGAAK